VKLWAFSVVAITLITLFKFAFTQVFFTSLYALDITSCLFSRLIFSMSFKVISQIMEI